MAEPRELRAYQVDGYDQSVLVFESNGAAARRRGAGLMDCQFEEVDSCRRQPALDVYAPGPVPPLVLIEHGWWFECGNCHRRIDDDMEQQDDEDAIEPYAVGEVVYCSRACYAQRAARWRQREAAVAAICELVQTHFPEAHIVRAHICDCTLEKAEPNGGTLSSCDFQLPGLKYQVSYRFREGYFVPRGDLDAFNELYAHRLQRAS
ncbi:hypothetical protein GGR77_001563 [Xanthomonas translucens]